jgi:hypothetical protein
VCEGPDGRLVATTVDEGNLSEKLYPVSLFSFPLRSREQFFCTNQMLHCMTLTIALKMYKEQSITG